MSPTINLIHADVLDGLRQLPAASVHVIVTSPPYWGLRAYAGVAPRTWSDGSTCVFGLEPSLNLYVQHAVEVFRELKRVLHPSGTFWLNIGDCYDHAGPQPSTGVHRSNGVPLPETFKRAKSGRSKKNLSMAPAKVAIALQDDGWILRNDIIWAKGLSFCPTYSGSVMPESIQDRAVWSHEHLFHFAINNRYFYDIEGSKEPYAASTQAQTRQAYEGQATKDYAAAGAQNPSDVKRRVLASVTRGGGRNLRNVWVIPKEPLKEAHFACVDAQTECLTITGWKHFDELQSGEPIAQFNLATNKLSWGPLKAISQYTVTNQEMVIAQSRDVDFCLTPNHRCVKTSYRQPKELDTCRADELTSQHTIPTAAAWESSGDYMPEDMAELIGWYVAEGHEIRDRQVGISQSLIANPQYVARIEELLISQSAKFSKHIKRRLWRGRPADMVEFRVKDCIAGYLRGFAPHKRLPTSVLSWSESSLNALLTGLVHGDGSTRSDGRFTFIQKDEYTIDLVQAIGVRLGYTVLKSRAKSDIFVLYFTRRKSRGFRGTNGQHPTLSRTRYSGTVWCPTTNLGTWVARRNGRVFITGNSFPTKLVEPPIKLGSSEFGCCPSCLNPYERVTHKEPVPADVQAAFNASRLTTEADTGRGDGYTHRKPNYRRKILGEGWRPTCKCGADNPIPCTVLDPFAGSGRAGVVAQRLGRSFIGIEASADYIKIAQKLLGLDVEVGDTSADIIEEGFGHGV